MASVEGLLLAGFVEGVDEVLTPKFFLELAESLRTEAWPITPPQPADEPDAGLGLRLHYPSAVGSESERTDLGAAERLLSLFADASRLSDAVIAVEYDGEVIGWIERGKLDDALSLGFLGEWRRTIGRP